MIQHIVSFGARILPFFAITLIVCEIVATNELAGVGKTIHEVDNRIDLLTQENELLTSEVASASSLVTVGAKAQILGFTNPTQYVTMGVEAVALNKPR